MRLNIKSIRQKLFYITIIYILVVINYLIVKNTNINYETPYAFLDNDGLYANVVQNGSNINTWQKWEKYYGENANEQNMYFILPKTEGNRTVKIYNNFVDSIVIGKKTIPAKSSMIIKYKEGEEIVVSKNNTFYKLIIFNSNSESSVFINDYSKSFVDYNKETVLADLYSFLIKDKRNAATNLKCTIVNNENIKNTILKKITGRGNATWFNSEKKAFNVEFYDKIEIGNLNCKEMCIISEGCDPTLLRNKIAYDLASDVGLPYAPKISYIDFYINGEYNGVYQIVEKIELKRDGLINLENNSKNMNKDFNFLVELDTANYYNDVYFLSDNGYQIVYKEPNIDLENENDANIKLKMNFIKEKYQNFENILYNGTLEELESVCDLNSLATMYLLQEFGKNCDAGYTSTYFLYNSKEEKIYVAPIWDCDCMFGAVVNRGIKASTYSTNYQGWYAKEAKYKEKVNLLGQCFNLRGKTKEGKTFEDLCISIWKERFIPSIKVLLNQDKSNGRVMSIEEYKNICEKSMYYNYIKWKFKNYYNIEKSRIDKIYTNDYTGEVEYLKDWIEKRKDWISAEFGIKAKEEQDDISYYLVGDKIGGWEQISEDNKLINNKDGTYSIEKLFKGNIEYRLMIVDNYNRKYAANYYDNITIEYSFVEKESGNAYFKYENDIQLIITLKGDYFTISPALSIENTEKPIPSAQKTIYFKNRLKWQDVYYYNYGDKYESYHWPGRKAELISEDKEGYGIYKIILDESQQKVIFSNGELDGQTSRLETMYCNENEIYEPSEVLQYEQDPKYKVYPIKKVEE